MSRRSDFAARRNRPDYRLESTAWRCRRDKEALVTPRGAADRRETSD